MTNQSPPPRNNLALGLMVYTVIVASAVALFIELGNGREAPFLFNGTARAAMALGQTATIFAL